MDFVREKNYSRHTIQAYQKDLSQFVEFTRIRGREDLLRVDYRFFRDYLAFLKTEGKSRTTIARKIATLRSFYKYLARQEKLVRNPLTGLTVPKREKKLPVFLYPQES